MSRKTAFLWVVITYLAALLSGVLVYKAIDNGNVLAATFCADIAATLVVWLSGLIFKNPSFYDAYWSVAPVIIILGWIAVSGKELTAGTILLLIVIGLWGIRLTYNWARGWQGIAHIDWRYRMIKQRKPRLWILSNLFGIHLMPTVIVFLGMIPVYYAVFSSSTVGGLSILGFVLCLIAIGIQTPSDQQMLHFRKSKSKDQKYIDRGLWRLSRHPNYFGEVLLWWGIWIMQMGLAGIWSGIIGPIAMTCLFLLISIPMMEKHLKGKEPAYREYQRSVSMLIPWFRKSR